MMKTYYLNTIFDILVKLWLVGDEYWRNPIPGQGKLICLKIKRKDWCQMSNAYVTCKP